jgi:ribonuclease P/MRP protein subunit POP5
LKRLMPSLRSKKRYLSFELISEETVSRSDLIREITASSAALLGDVASSECDIKLFGFEEGKGIIHCAHTKVKETRASMAAVIRINGKRATLHVLGSSGTVKRATEKFLANYEKFEVKTGKFEPKAEKNEKCMSR